MPEAAAALQPVLDFVFDAPEDKTPPAPPVQQEVLAPAPVVLQDVAEGEPAEIMTAAWRVVMDTLQAELSGPTYQNYLRQVRPLRLSADRLVLTAPSDFVKDWLVRRFARRIEETLEDFIGRPILLSFQITAPETVEIIPVPEQVAAPEHPAMAVTEPEVAPAPLPPRSRGVSVGGDDFEDFSSPLNRKYTFDNFIVGRSNYVSHAAAWAVANAPAKGQYNPLFIYGGVGLGKTHLMQAIGHHITKVRNSPVEIAYVSGENFLYQVVRCIREDRMTAFRRRYRNVDVWLVDDIQYICNAERTEVEFFHIFNTLYDQGKQIVICSDKPPKELQLTESRLLSRFEWGLISYVEAPDLEHRIAILQKRAQIENITVPAEVLVYLAEKIRSNIRSLEGAFTRLLAMASLDGRKINLDLAAETVRYYSTAESEPVRVGVDSIIDVTCDNFRIDRADMLGKKRNKEIVVPRQIAMYLAREMAGMSYPDIGRAFDRDYTTVIHSYEKVKAEIKRDTRVKNLVSEIRSRAHARG